MEPISSDGDQEVLKQISGSQLEREASDEEIDHETHTEHENAPGRTLSKMKMR
jgi:hypothetical protein